MKRRIILASVLGSCWCGSIGHAHGQDPLASPAIDASIYKDGAVRQREASFGKWHTKCQEISKVKKRVCNLLSSVTAETGENVGSVLIATTDTGIPAMVIAMPSELSLSRSLLIEAGQIKKIDGKLVKVEYSSILKPTICDNQCKYMFPLDSKLVFLLNGGDRARLVWAPPDGTARLAGVPKSRPDSKFYEISGVGFADALAESLRTWD